MARRTCEPMPERRPPAAWRSQFGELSAETLPRVEWIDLALGGSLKPAQCAQHFQGDRVRLGLLALDFYGEEPVALEGGIRRTLGRDHELELTQRRDGLEISNVPVEAQLAKPLRLTRGLVGPHPHEICRRVARYELRFGQIVDGHRHLRLIVRSCSGPHFAAAGGQDRGAS